MKTGATPQATPAPPTRHPPAAAKHGNSTLRRTSAPVSNRHTKQILFYQENGPRS